MGCCWCPYSVNVENIFNRPMFSWGKHQLPWGHSVFDESSLWTRKCVLSSAGQSSRGFWTDQPPQAPWSDALVPDGGSPPPSVYQGRCAHGMGHWLPPQALTQSKKTLSVYPTISCLFFFPSLYIQQEYSIHYSPASLLTGYCHIFPSLVHWIISSSTLRGFWLGACDNWWAKSMSQRVGFAEMQHHGQS